MIRTLDKLLAFCFLGAGLAGCSSSPTPNYYTIAPQLTNNPAITKIRVIEVLPVNVPDRINRVPIVINEASGQAKILDNERWTSPLNAELRDGLSAGLQQKLGAVDRYNSGISDGQTAYRIATDFSKFDIVKSSSTSNQYIDVAVSWIIKRITPFQANESNQTANKNNQLNCKMLFKQPLQSNNISNMVAGSRQSLEQVIETMSSSVVAFEANTTLVKNAQCTLSP